MGDPIPGPLDITRIWFHLPDMKGEARAEAIAKLEEWLNKRDRRTRST